MAYYRVFIVSGLPDRILSDLESRRQSLVGEDEKFIGISAEDLPAASNYANQVSSVVEPYFHYDRQKRYATTHLVHLFFDFGRHDIEHASKGLYFCFSVSHPATKDLNLTKLSGREGKLGTAILKLSQRYFNSARKCLDALRRELQDGDASTPLLLPLRNFSSRDFGDCLRTLPQLMCDSDEPSGKVRAETKHLEQSTKRANRDRQWVFTDDRDRAFKSPPKAGARHGNPSNTNPHNTQCYLNGHLRLGVAYHSKFHYDCSGRSAITEDFRSCHQDAVSARGASYVNIAPNDNVRVPAASRKN